MAGHGMLVTTLPQGEISHDTNWPDQAISSGSSSRAGCSMSERERGGGIR